MWLSRNQPHKQRVIFLHDFKGHRGCNFHKEHYSVHLVVVANVNIMHFFDVVLDLGLIVGNFVGFGDRTSS